MTYLKMVVLDADSKAMLGVTVQHWQLKNNLVIAEENYYSVSTTLA